MNTIMFDELVETANEAASQENWSKALEYLEKANLCQPGQAGVFCGMGTCYLQLNQPENALQSFLQAADLLPESADVQYNLGLLYQLSGNEEAALAAYQRAVNLDNNHWTAWKSMAVLYLHNEEWEQGVGILASIIRANPEEIDAKFLLAQCYELGEDYNSARLLYEAVLKEQPEHQEARAALDRLPLAVPSRPFNKVAIYAQAGTPGEQRMQMVARALTSQDKLGHLFHLFSIDHLDEFDHFIFSQPHLAGDSMNGILACLRAKKTYGIDIDGDYLQIPPSHPAYRLWGPGNEQLNTALAFVLKEAAWVSVPSQELARRLHGFARDVRFNPPTWDRRDPEWRIPAPAHTMLQVGWIGTQIERQDLLSIREDLMRFFRSNPNARLIIAGDQTAYNRFVSLPHQQREFKPLSSWKDIPRVLAQFDILLVPWQQNVFNLARSDQALLEAGIRQIPWVASPIPAYTTWGAGGLIASNSDDWLTALQQLAVSPDLRKQLGAAGRALAEKR